MGRRRLLLLECCCCCFLGFFTMDDGDALPLLLLPLLPLFIFNGYAGQVISKYVWSLRLQWYSPLILWSTAIVVGWVCAPWYDNLAYNCGLPNGEEGVKLPSHATPPAPPDAGLLVGFFAGSELFCAFCCCCCCCCCRLRRWLSKKPPIPPSWFGNNYNIVLLCVCVFVCKRKKIRTKTI